MVTAVMGARGGVGATTLAVAMAARSGAGAVLVDVDGLGGGLDAWLGAEDVPGVRWSGLRLAGGELLAAELVAALPSARGVAVLAADRADLPTSAGLAQVLDVLVDRFVVVDLPRRLDEVTAAVLERCGLLVLVTPGSVSGVLAAHTLAAALGDAAPTGLVVVGHEVAAASVAAATGVAVLGVARHPDRLDRVAVGLVDGLLA